MTTHPVVHVEFAASNLEAAGKFYAGLFGWKIQLMPEMNYAMFETGHGPGGGFSPVGTSAGPVSYKPGDVLVYVGTDDIDASLAKAKALGGKILLPKTEIPGTGWFGIFADPTGNRVGLYTGLGEQHA